MARVSVLLFVPDFEHIHGFWRSAFWWVALWTDWDANYWSWLLRVLWVGGFAAVFVYSRAYAKGRETIDEPGVWPGKKPSDWRVSDVLLGLVLLTVLALGFEVAAVVMPGFVVLAGFMAVVGTVTGVVDAGEERLSRQGRLRVRARRELKRVGLEAKVAKGSLVPATASFAQMVRVTRARRLAGLPTPITIRLYQPVWVGSCEDYPFWSGDPVKALALLAGLPSGAGVEQFRSSFQLEEPARQLADELDRLAISEKRTSGVWVQATHQPSSTGKTWHVRFRGRGGSRAATEEEFQLTEKHAGIPSLAQALELLRQMPDDCGPASFWRHLDARPSAD